GGVGAVLAEQRHGLVDNWLRHVDDVRQKHRDLMRRAMTPEQRHACLCELNVIEQAANVCRTTIVQDAWDRGQPLGVHGWCYSLENGLVRDLGLHVSDAAGAAPAAEAAIRAVGDGTIP